jgi:structure-specific recognition protein 1
VHKPAIYIKFDGIASVNFARMSGSAGVSRSFDFEVEMKDGNAHHFSSLMK